MFLPEAPLPNLQIGTHGLRPTVRCAILDAVGLEPAPLLRYRCTGCGYGASRRGAPERCPMCGGEHWEEEGWKPFAALAADLTPVAPTVAADADAPLAREAVELSVLPGVPLS